MYTYLSIKNTNVDLFGFVQKEKEKGTNISNSLARYIKVSHKFLPLFWCKMNIHDTEET